MRFFSIFIVIAVFTALVPAQLFAETEAERKLRLETELQNVERQILKQQVLVEDKQLEKQSLERDLNILDAQIGKAKLGIHARSVAIEQIGDQVYDKISAISELDRRLKKQTQSLGQLLRKTQEIDDYALVEIMLGNKNLSEFLEDLDSFQSIKLSLNESVTALKMVRTDTEEQKSSLEEKKISEAEMMRLQEIEKAEIEKREADKEKILMITKGEEKAYQELLASQQQTASEIRNQLFELAGGGQGIPFHTALSLAEFASARSGVSEALILAILQQESSYGSNIGSCIYDDIVQGRDVMHPDRDQPVFTALASALGFNPRSQQVSCPWIRSGERIGWGGAMGPSQFIPSTWKIYGGIVNVGNGWEYNKSEDSIRKLTGKTSPSSPFNNQDAFMATALLMRDNGAGAGTYAAERLAALRYFAGWGGASNPINFPYGDGVMNKKASIENQIRIVRGL